MSTVLYRQENDPHLLGRIEWVDVAKGVGIFLVCFWRYLGWNGRQRHAEPLRLGRLDRTLHLRFPHAAFLFPGGIFVTRSAHRTFHAYLLNKASVIVYPYFLWSILTGLPQILASRFTNNHFSVDDLLRIVYQPIDQYWFLYVIFTMYVVYWWIHHIHISNDIFYLLR